MQAPVQPQERIEIIDILRGFALFGVLLVNITSFKSSSAYPAMVPSSLSPVWDQGAFWFISLFAVAKFYTAFSFLFGLGFYLFMEKAEQKGLHPQKLFKRRLFFLLLMGLIHLSFVWSGDILHTYAIAGLILLGAWHKNLQQIKKRTLFFLVMTVLLLSLVSVLVSLSGSMVEGEALMGVQEELNAVEILQYQNGSYLEILAYRLSTEVPSMLFNNLLAVPLVLPLFHMGFYAGKKGIFKNLGAHVPQIKRVFLITLILGILLTLLALAVRLNPWGLTAFTQLGINEVMTYLSGIVMSLLYMSAMILLYLKKKGLGLFKPLAKVGRMALTNYLCQSILGTWIFYGYGLGYFGNTGAFAGVVLTIVIFAAQMVISHYWLKGHPYGPMEKLWRSYTYSGQMKEQQVP